MALFGRHLTGIHFDELEPAVAGVLCLIEAVSNLQAAEQEIAAGDQREVAARGRLERASDHGRIIETRYRRENVQFVAISVKEIHGDARMRPCGPGMEAS